jgi:3-methylcrotonyl-CoA carboxylase alpha subunit
MFARILIANRGEIACRVIDTCRRLGIATVAIYSDADANARHVRLADEAWRVGPAAASESYLRADRVIEVAQQAGAEAVHPGYGFLSENADFARACAEAGLVFIGPPAESIRAMGSKSAAKALMQKAGVPLVAGYHGDDQRAGQLAAEAERIGYPVMIKASAGGGGKGMRVVRVPEEFAEVLASCQRESRASFGDDRMLVEKYLERPRHIEIQVFADTQGHTLSLFERDCSSQRRHQKVVEEAPAPSVDAAQREAMGRSACDAAQAVGYVGAGTVEFIVDSDGVYYFMEMNTRLQVEHPITEMITGLDLVEWQLRVAAGEPLPRTQDGLTIKGHAIEVRVYAETPDNGFLPSVGRLAHLALPALGPDVRWDSGVAQGDQITPYYDPMIAKLIVHAHDRVAAIARMRIALGELEIIGVGHNVDFLACLIDHPAFRDASVDTGLIERDMQFLVASGQAPPAPVAQAAALAQLASERRASAQNDDSPWAAGDGWRLNSQYSRRLNFAAGEHDIAVDVEYADGAWRVDGLRAALHVDGVGHYRVVLGGRQFAVHMVEHGSAWHVFLGGQHYRLDYRDALAEAIASEEVESELTAPMPGRIVSILQETGTPVDKGAPLLVMEAMKMELTIAAPANGRVTAYCCAEGDQVMDGDELVEFEPDG